MGCPASQIPNRGICCLYQVVLHAIKDEVQAPRNAVSGACERLAAPPADFLKLVDACLGPMFAKFLVCFEQDGAGRVTAHDAIP